MAPAPSASAFPLHPNSCLLDEHDRMLFQHSHPTGTDAERTTLQEGVEGFSAAISKAIQPQSHALHLDQRAGTLPTHHRSNERVPGSSSQATKAAEDQPTYYKELTVRCTSCKVMCSAAGPSFLASAAMEFKVLNRKWGSSWIFSTSSCAYANCASNCDDRNSRSRYLP